jgi:outer membrane receptor protein involved in Fe transport
MMKFSRLLIISFALLLASTVAFAQGTTGTLSGTATSGGSGLPGVTVTVSSPALQGTRTTVTGETGGYVFPALPPGDYTIRFELSGMQTTTKRAKVSLAQTTPVDAELQVTAVTEAITVTATAPAVLETTQVSANFTAQQIDNLPVQRNVRDTVLLSPGVTATGPANQIMISGAPSYDNVFLVNGVVVNENLRGQPHNLFIEDAIQETTIMTGGAISAEYGRFTGGVVSTITKSGGNTFSGSLRDTLTNPSWTDKTPIPTQADPPDKLTNLYEATLGGYMMKDRLWFFGAGRRSRKVPTGTNITTVRSTTAAKAGDPIFNYENYNDEDRYEVKLTGRITDRHTLVGSYLDVSLTETNNAFTPIGDLESIVPTRSLPNQLKAVNYNGILTNNFLVEAQWSEKTFAFEQSGGRDTSFTGGTWVGDNATGIRYNAPVFCGVCTAEGRNNESWIVKGNYYLTTRGLGSHDFRAGVEDFAEQRIVNNYQSASQYQITTGQVRVVNGVPFPRFDSSTNFIYRPIFNLSNGSDLATQSAFINDKWDLNRHWSFNVGVRYDRNNGKDSSGNTVSDDSAISPRVGGIFDIHGDGRFRVNASYARYVSKIADGNVGGSVQAAGNPAYFRYSYTGPSINGTSVPDNQLVPMRTALDMLWNWFQGIGGFEGATPNATAVPGFSARFEGSIKSPYVDEFNIGFGSRIGNSAFARIDYITRDWGNFYGAHLDTTTGQVTDPYGNAGDQSITINDDSFTREYQGIQTQAQWTRARWTVGGNYTWSTLKGNDESEQQGTATVRNQGLDLWYPEFLNYERRLPAGYLNGDQRHRASAWVSYDLPTLLGNFNFSLLQRYASGQAYSAIAIIDAGLPSAATGRQYPNMPANPGYRLSQIGNSHNYYISERGEYRTDPFDSTDLALNYARPMGRISLILQADLLNAFGRENAIDLSSSRIDTTVRTRRQGATTTDGLAQLTAFNPRTNPSDLRQYIPGVSDPAAGPYHYQLSPTFGEAVSVDAYQTPRTYRFSAGLRF